MFSTGFRERFEKNDVNSNVIELPRHSLSCLWVGMVQFDELLGGEMFNTDLSHPYIELLPKEKKVQVIARYRLQILCEFKFENYPMDSQDCTLAFKPSKFAS